MRKAQCGPVGIWSCGGPGDRGVFLGFCCLDMVQKGQLRKVCLGDWTHRLDTYLGASYLH